MLEPCDGYLGPAAAAEGDHAPSAQSCSIAFSIFGVWVHLHLTGALVCPQTHVSEYRGHRVAVDAYCWLHRGAYSCSAELCEGQATNRCLQLLTPLIMCIPRSPLTAVLGTARRYVDYCMRLVEMLRHHGVHPMVVFDGGRLPMKGKEEGSRAQCVQCCTAATTQCCRACFTLYAGTHTLLLALCRPAPSMTGLPAHCAGTARSPWRRRRPTRPPATARRRWSATSAQSTSVRRLRCASYRHAWHGGSKSQQEV